MAGAQHIIVSILACRLALTLLAITLMAMMYGFIPPMLDLLILIALVALLIRQAYSNHKILTLKPLLGAKSLVGSTCRTATPLTPEGYVKLNGELWRARAHKPIEDAGSEVVVMFVHGNMLIVGPLEEKGKKALGGSVNSSLLLEEYQKPLD